MMKYILMQCTWQDNPRCIKVFPKSQNLNLKCQIVMKIKQICEFIFAHDITVQVCRAAHTNICAIGKQNSR